ncbi:MAG: hypothetical protein KBS66_03550, partial [Eubacterium sp.]|nr:hypothetical protein [Candidatus Colimonas fimequi]
MGNELYDKLLSMGYPERFCNLIDVSLNTDYCKQRMLRYLYRWENPSMEEVADEMLAITAERDKFQEKIINEQYNSKWNDFLAWRREQEDE